MQISKKFNNPEMLPPQESSSFCPELFDRPSFKELEKLIGLTDVKKLLAEITAFSLIQIKRSEQNLKSQPVSLHMIFKGNPGTGKTTVARILGRIFKDIGLLNKGHLIEVERADLVGEYIGHTAQKAKESVQKALGGILFVDEAYTLAQGGEKDFGREAIATIVKQMEDNRDNVVVILAGYCNEMDHFVRSNPGLRSRFPIHIQFDDYCCEELFQIALHLYNERDYVLSSSGRWRLKHILTDFTSHRHPHSGNARFVRNLTEKSIRRQALRLIDKTNLSRKDLTTIEDVDMPELSDLKV